MPEVNDYPSFDTQRQKSFDYNLEATKQLLTVATAIIAFTVTFAKDFVGGVSTPLKWVAGVGWVFYLISIGCGLLTINTMTGQLDGGSLIDVCSKTGVEIGRPHRRIPSIWAPSVNIAMRMHYTMFGAGLTCTVLFGLLAVIFPVQQEKPQKISIIQTPDALKAANETLHLLQANQQLTNKLMALVLSQGNMQVTKPETCSCSHQGGSEHTFK